MDQQTRDAVTFLLGTFLSVLVIMGLAVRYVLIPYLRDHLIAKVDETHKQVTENHHASTDQPTVLDRISDVDQAVGGVKIDVKALAHVMDEHMAWSDRWTALWEREIENLKAKQENGDTDEDSTA